MALIVSGVDLGSDYLKVAVCQYHKKTGDLAVLALVKKPSAGIRHGFIVDSDEAAAALGEALREAGQTAGFKIKRAILGVGGAGLANYISSGSVVISRADSEVAEFDINRAVSASESPVASRANLKIIHTIPQDFKIDGKKIFGKPAGNRGSRLEARTLFITTTPAHFKESTAVLALAGVEIEDVFATSMAEAAVAISPLAKSAGCVLVNIGGQTTSIIVFDEGIPTSVGVWPIGSSDITKDIALAFRISLEMAEGYKLGQRDLETKQIKKKMSEVIEARVSDIFELVDAHLKKIGRSGLLPAGVIFSGGGAGLTGLAELAREYLGLPARVGENTILPAGYNLGEIKNSRQIPTRQVIRARERLEQVKKPEWSVAFGLCLLGLSLEAEEDVGLFLSGRTKNRLYSWLRQFLP